MFKVKYFLLVPLSYENLTHENFQHYKLLTKLFNKLICTFYRGYICVLSMKELRCTATEYLSDTSLSA